MCGYIAYEAGYYFIDRRIERRLENNKQQALIHFIAFESMQSLSRAEIDEAFSGEETDPSKRLCAHGLPLFIDAHAIINPQLKVIPKNN